MASFASQYYENVLQLFEDIITTQHEPMAQAAEKMAQTMCNNRLIHVFGCGHSHILADELFYRAGGLANIDAMFDSSVMLHEGAAKSSKIERMHDIAPLLLNRYNTEPDDVLLIASNSGVNAYSIDMALAAREKGLFVVVIGSGEYRTQASKHKSGQHLADVCNVYIDSGVCHGDASVVVTNDGQKSGPLSTMASLLIGNMLVLDACELAQKQGHTPGIFKSGNMSGTSVEEHNQNLIRQFKQYIRHL